MLWVGRDHYNDEFCAGTLVAVCTVSVSTEPFAVHVGGIVSKTRNVPLHGIVVLQVLSYNAPASVSCFVCRQALVRRIQAGVLVHACRMSSLEIALRWLALIHASGPSVLSTSRWRACRPHRLGSQAAAGGSGLPVLLAGSGMHQYMCVFVAVSGLVPMIAFCLFFSAHRVAGKLRVGKFVRGCLSVCRQAWDFDLLQVADTGGKGVDDRARFSCPRRA